MEEARSATQVSLGQHAKVAEDNAFRPEIFGLIQERGGVVLPHEMSNAAGGRMQYGYPVGMPFPAKIPALYKGQFIECNVQMIHGHLEVELPQGGVVHMSVSRRDRVNYLGNHSLMGSGIQLVHLEIGMTEKLAAEDDFVLMGASQPEPLARPKLKI